MRRINLPNTKSKTCKVGGVFFHVKNEDNGFKKRHMVFVASFQHNIETTITNTQ